MAEDAREPQIFALSATAEEEATTIQQQTFCTLDKCLTVSESRAFSQH